MAQFGRACCHYTHLKRVSFVSFIDRGQDRFVDPEAECGSDEGEGQVTHNTNKDDLIMTHILAIPDFMLTHRRLVTVTHLMRLMYLTARRHTRTEPHTMPESRGFCQYSRAFIWSLEGHMMLVSLSLCSCVAMVTPGSPGLGVTGAALAQQQQERQPCPA